MTKPKVLKRYQRRRVVTDCSGPSRTEQSHREACDVNGILAKYRRTGVLPPMKSDGMYGDFVGLPDYQESLNLVNRAREAFDSLPAQVRRNFENDPANLLRFLDGKPSLEELAAYGLAETQERRSQRAEPVSQASENAAPAASEEDSEAVDG